MAKPLDNEMRTYILTELSTKKNLSFNALFNKKFYSSSQFAYHLNWLLSRNYVSKINGKYNLGSEGKKLISYVSSGIEVKQPLIVIGLILKNKNQILVSKSKKEPLNELWGLSCFGKYKDVKILAKEKTGYELNNYKFHGSYDVKTSDLDLHHLLLVYSSSEFKGTLKSEPLRECIWVTRAQLKKMKQFPENEFIIDNPGNHIIERNISENSYLVK
jgi:hypothetical protein